MNFGALQGRNVIDSNQFLRVILEISVVEQCIVTH